MIQNNWKILNYSSHQNGKMFLCYFNGYEIEVDEGG